MDALALLTRAIECAGPTQDKFAKAIGKKQSYVSMLMGRLKKKRPVPVEICPAIEAATNGEISRHDLRPDFFGPAPKRRRAA